MAWQIELTKDIGAMMKTTNFNVRLDKELRDRAFPVFERYGLSASQAFKLFLNQVAETNRIPLSFDYAATVPNAKTAKAIKQGREGYQAGSLIGYSPDEVSQALMDKARDQNSDLRQGFYGRLAFILLHLSHPIHHEYIVHTQT